MLTFGIDVFLGDSKVNDAHMLILTQAEVLIFNVSVDIAGLVESLYALKHTHQQMHLVLLKILKRQGSIYVIHDEILEILRFCFDLNTHEPMSIVLREVLATI